MYKRQLLRNVFFAGALANFAVCALSIANRIKIEVRDEPVFPRDFALLKEAGSAVGTYDIQFPVPSIAAVVVFSLVLVCLLYTSPDTPAFWFLYPSAENASVILETFCPCTRRRPMQRSWQSRRRSLRTRDIRSGSDAGGPDRRGLWT